MKLPEGPRIGGESPKPCLLFPPESTRAGCMGIGRIPNAPTPNGSVGAAIGADPRLVDCLSFAVSATRALSIIRASQSKTRGGHSYHC